MELTEAALEAAPTETADTVVFHGNVSFTQPIYQYASASVSATLDRNWTVSVSPGTVSLRGPGTQTFTVSVEAPTSARGREVANLKVVADYSTRFGATTTVEDSAIVRVRSWVGYRINATGPYELVVSQGSSSNILLPVKNVGNEPEYFSGNVPYWFGLRSMGIVTSSPSSILIKEKEEVSLEFTITAGPDTVPRAFLFDLVVDAHSLTSGGEGATADPRTIEAEVLVTGQSPLGNPYDVWTRGEPPETIPPWESIFGSAQSRHNPDIDASGRYVVFDQSVDGENAIYLGEASGAGAMRLTRGHNDHNPVFSPNGQMIAFSRAPDRIIVVNHNGTELMEFGSELGGVNVTDWAPAGDRLLLDSGGNIYELNLVSNTTRLLAGEPVEQWGAVYSPDGSAIFYISFEAAGRHPEIWFMTSDGSSHLQLTYNDLRERFVSVSPNGKRVAFTLGEENHQADRVCVMNPDGTDVRYFTDRTHRVYLLRWLPGGDALMAEVSSLETGDHDIQRVAYPWKDAGFSSNDGGGVGGASEEPWYEGSIYSFISQPIPCLAIFLAIIVVIILVVGQRRKDKARAEAAERLRHTTGIDDEGFDAVWPLEAAVEVAKELL
jgi:hypothetical protein